MHVDQVRSILPGIAVSVGTSNTQLLPRRKNRYQAFIQNSHASIVIRVGRPAELTAGRGIPLAAGEFIDWRGPGPISAVAASGTVSVLVVETVAGANIADTPRDSQVTVTQTVAQILPKDKQRQYAIIHNIDAADTVCVGGTNLITATTKGILVAPGKRITIAGPAAIWAITGAGLSAVLTIAQERRF